jgi:hypothetical protein
MAFLDEESTYVLLRLLVSGLQALEGQVWSFVAEFPDDGPLGEP